MSRFPLLRLLAVATFATLLNAPGAQARDYQAGALTISRPWLRPPPPGAPTAAGYLTLVNHGKTPDRLLGGTFEGTGKIEVHEMTMTGQIMRMRPLTGGLVIGPGQTVTLSPGGDRHLMFVGPKHALKVGDQVPATLRFGKAGSVRLFFTVQEAAPADAMHGMDMH